jgi:hypothetical protein
MRLHENAKPTTSVRDSWLPPIRQRRDENNETIVMAAVEWNCPPIRQRGDENNETIVMAAVQQNGTAL